MNLFILFQANKPVFDISLTTLQSIHPDSNYTSIQCQFALLTDE